MIEELNKKFTKEIEQMQDISQYFSIMNGASVANTNIGFYKSNIKLENLITSCDKHNLCNIEEIDVINYSTSNYLGLGQNKEVVKASIEALTTFGTGSNGSPILSGYYKSHHNLEKELSEIHNYDDTLLVSSGFMANIIVLTTLYSKNDTIFLEKNSHGSIIMGAKLSGAKIKLFEENNTEQLEKLLKNDKSKNKLIVTCGVFSMSGKITNLPLIVKLAKQNNCMTMLDDAHAFGIIGENGLGTVEYHNLKSSDIDIHVGTLNKSLSASGGYICAKQEVIKYLRLKALPYILSASIPPVIVAGATKSLEIIKKDGKELSKELIEKQEFFKKELLKNNIEAIGDSAIVVIPIGNTERTLKISKFLHENKIYANGIIPPGVRRGQERIRFNITLTHSFDDLKYTIEIIKKSFKL
jgi:7-keto-8-aminopelargonate synthetase-like enzyme